MTGRTNITGGGMNLNAEVQEFTVANGKNVVSGDFVSWRTVKKESVLTYSDIEQGKTEQVGENLVVTQSGEALYLLEMVNGNLRIVSSYSEKPVGGFCIMQDGGIAVAVKSSPYLVRLVVGNANLEVSSEAQNVSVTIPTPFGVEEKDGKLYVLGRYSAFEVRLYPFTYSAGGMTLESSTYIEINLGNNISGLDWTGAFSASGNIFIISNYVQGNRFVYKIAFNSGNTTVKTEQVSEKGLKTLFPVSFFDKYVIFSSSYNLYIYNAETEEMKEIDMHGFGFPATDSYTAANRNSAFAKHGDNELAIFFNGGGSSYLSAVVFRVANSGNLEMASNIFKLKFESASVTTATNMYLFFVGNSVNPTCYASNATRCISSTYDSASEQLTDYVEPNYVEPYTGGLAIGVAKQSGKSGQTIEVYVAKPSA